MEGEFYRQQLLSGVVLMVICLLVLDRGGVGQGAVEPVGVEPVHPGQGGQLELELELVDGAEWAVGADALSL